MKKISMIALIVFLAVSTYMLMAQEHANLLNEPSTPSPMTRTEHTALMLAQYQLKAKVSPLTSTEHTALMLAQYQLNNEDVNSPLTSTERTALMLAQYHPKK